jgi:Bacterial aa3 type cytochrome c oxidase subunit IV
MASAHSDSSHADSSHEDYKHGSMDISEQSSTFDGFIKWSIWLGLLTICGILSAVLIWGFQYPWLNSVFAGVALGAVLGALLRMKLAWYLTLVGVIVVSLIGAGVAGLVGMFA